MHTIPGYHIKTTLGDGGMASVFLATQTSLDRAVAIKVLEATLNRDKRVQQKFTQESKIIAQLNHPNIVQVIDQATTEQGLPYFVMPYVKSITLSAILKRADVSVTRKLDILIQICSALAYAHRNGIIHRDIKPANVLVDYDGHVRLVDFGIAGYFTPTKALPDDAGITMGTSSYMAPEQREGKTSHLSDIYAFGVVMHEVLFSEHPSRATEASYRNVKNDKHNFARHLKPIIDQCIETQASKRPASAEKLRQTLLLIAQGRHLRANRWGEDAKRDNLPPNYTLLDVIKENPFGATYLVNDPNRQRLLVIKKQNLDHLGKAPVDAAKLTHIQHPHLARIYGTGKNKRVFIVVSEYLAAGSLQDRLTQAFNLGQWIIIAQQLCNALSCAHSYGITHGNLRPSNILFAENNHLKLSDFGFPAHTYGEDGHWYQPPNEPISNTTDIYATGSILFQLLSGKLPNNQWLGLKNRYALRHLPKGMRSIILQMIASNPKKRMNSAETAAQLFNDVQEDQETRIFAEANNEDRHNGKIATV